MIRILCLEGGGKKGAITTSALKNIDQWLNNKNGESVQDYFDFIIGQSVGGILAAALACGKTPKFMNDNFKNICEQGFNRNLKTIFTPGKYSHEYMRNALSDIIPPSKKMKDSDKFNLGVGAINKDADPDKNVMFTKINAPNRNILDIVQFSYAAPYYFGYKFDPVTEKTYADAGIGIHNTPIFESLNMISEQFPEYYNEKKKIVSLGTGNNYKEGNAKNFGSIREGIDYLGIAKEQAEDTQVRFIENFAKQLKTKLYHFDVHIEEKYDKLDKSSYDYYQDKGNEMSEKMKEIGIGNILH